ncbi:MAG TPA: secondary thiamine-phosphate synthase enzyme YjbQ [Candidatus Sulfomarinibacteraceae bacterium]|nr:secondary thiamine-phosphate synthase enzyme YjbQ [Candidatus Sulfomarinibacteraceae bacterium]
MIELTVRSGARTELIDITAEVTAAVAELDPEARLCHVWVPHTTAAVVVNEAADPDVARDLAAAYRAMVPDIRFRHAEGNSDAHLLSTVLGCSVTLPVVGGRPHLGTWQGVFFVELDGPRSRRVWVEIL